MTPTSPGRAERPVLHAEAPVDARATRLRVEHRHEPIGVDVAPRFGWSLEAGDRPPRQRSWRILLHSGGALVHDSGAVPGDDCVDVELPLPPLRSLTRYRWTLRVGTDRGELTAVSSFVTGVLHPQDWEPSRWIGGHGRAAPFLRHEFTVDHPPSAAWLVVAAGGYARTHLDGTLVEPSELSPGFTDYDERVQYTVSDVRDLVRPGRHALGAELGRGFYGMAAANTWEWHTAPWHDEPCLRLLLVLDGPGGRRVVGTGENWRTTAGPTGYDDLYGGETYDARAERPGCWAPGHDDSGWLPARVAAGPRGRLVHQRQQPIGVAEVLPPERVREVSPGTWVFSFPRVVAGRVRVRARGAAGRCVVLEHAERLGPDGVPDVRDEKGYYAGRFQRHELLLDGDPLSWHPRFTYQGFQHVAARADERPEVHAEVVRTLVARTGDFACSSPLLTRLHELTVDTVLNNLHGIPTDTPQYEKNGWTGDGMLGAQLMLLNLDAHELLAKWVTDIADSRHGGAVPQVIAPHGGWSVDWSPAPPWHAALVLVPWWIHEATGDTRVLRGNWEAMTAYARAELARSPGGIASTTLGDWVAPGTDAGGGNPDEDLRVSATAFLFAVLDTLARAAPVVGRPAAEWRSAAAAVRRAFHRAFVDPVAGVVRGAGEDGHRQSHAVLAVALGLVGGGLADRVVAGLAADVLRRRVHLDTGALATKWLLPVLTRHGHPALALALAEQTTFPSWGFWLEQGATSLWEHWKPESRSRGHYFLGTLDDWLFHHVAGLRPLSPGWRRALVRPAPLALTWARGRVLTPRGPVSVSWERDGDDVRAEVEVPAGATALLVLGDVREDLPAGRHRVRARVPAAAVPAGGAPHQAV
ncbi:family 78 glycoside hydrolase catalytic domain [Kineococcus esterisolvens]|uniref:family 78 glycoside hydrolase catalytic domain n=1 Tax=unclassified Kineococcus TaxID=2621656 RepID=UPI003D7E8572